MRLLTVTYLVLFLVSCPPVLYAVLRLTFVQPEPIYLLPISLFWGTLGAMAVGGVVRDLKSTRISI